MTKVTLTQAAQIVQRDRTTVFRWVEDGLLPASRVGIRRDIFIETDDLRSFAKTNNYPFDQALAEQYGMQ